MKLENQVCSEEQGKRLLELGVTAPPLYFHLENMGIQPYHHIKASGSYSENDLVHETLEGIHSNYCYPAFTVSELGVMLPSYYYSVSTMLGEWGMSNTQEAVLLNTHKLEDVDELIFGDSATEAQARAAMLIYLIEYYNSLDPDNKFVEEVNARLIS